MINRILIYIIIGLVFLLLIVGGFAYLRNEGLNDDLSEARKELAAAQTEKKTLEGNLQEIRVYNKSLEKYRNLASKWEKEVNRLKLSEKKNEEGMDYTDIYNGILSDMYGVPNNQSSNTQNLLPIPSKTSTNLDRQK